MAAERIGARINPAPVGVWRHETTLRSEEAGNEALPPSSCIPTNCIYHNAHRFDNANNCNDRHNYDYAVTRE